MYHIHRTKDFEKSFKKLRRSGKITDSVIFRMGKVIDMLQSGRDLPDVYKDHQLQGILRDYRECHIKHDLLLVLVDIGTHAGIFG